MKMVRGLEGFSCKERLRHLGLFRAKKVLRRSYCGVSVFKDAYQRAGVRLFTKVCSGRTRSNNFKLKDGRLDCI